MKSLVDWFTKSKQEKGENYGTILLKIWTCLFITFN